MTGFELKQNKLLFCVVLSSCYTSMVGIIVRLVDAPRLM